MDIKSKKVIIAVSIALSFIIVIATTIFILKALIKTSQIPVTDKTPIVTLKQPVVTTEEVASGLLAPTGIIATSIPNDKRLFITERSGVIRSIIPGEKNPPQAFLDIQSKVRAEGEMGLLGLAFHPNYKQNSYLFVNYVDKNQNTIIARFTANSDRTIGDANSEKILLTLKQPYANHNGGDLVFGPDGYLYVALGDGGSGGDPENRAQDKNSLFGKILRIDINKGDPYEVPITNPFANEPGTKPEIWAYGLRNPWRMSFDKKTGDLYIADVGQGALEEINVQKAESKGGENYGWRCFEGTAPYNSAGCQTANKYIAPVLEYNHDENRCSITGGYVYRGQQNPALLGKYFYGDFCNGQLFYAEQKNDKWTQTLAARTGHSISAFGQGNDGEVYLADFKTNAIYKLKDTAN